MDLFLSILGVILLISLAITAWRVKGKPATISTITLDSAWHSVYTLSPFFGTSLVRGALLSLTMNTFLGVMLSPYPVQAVTVGTSGDRFTINGQPVFLLGVSYFDAMNWRPDDLDAFSSRGYNLIRIFLDWGVTSSALDHSNGDFIGQQSVLELIRAANARGLVVDVTVLNFAASRDPNLVVLEPTIGNVLAGNNAATATVTNVINALKNEPNVIFDIRNEHNLRLTDPSTLNSVVNDPDSTPLYNLTSLAKGLHPTGIIFASSAGLIIASDNATVLSAKVNEELIQGGFTLLAPHLHRDANWHTLTGSRVSALKSVAPQTPIYLQEENRQRWEGNIHPVSNFLDAVRNAKNAGAAGWVFHTFAGFNMLSSSFMNNLFDFAGCQNPPNRCESKILDELPGVVFGGPAGKRIEAESMALANGTFGVEANSVASNGNVMAFLNGTATETGAITTTFTGASGKYDIELGYFDESDGAGSFTIKINDVVRATVLLNQNTSGTGLADQQAYHQAIVATGIHVNTGDQIRIEGVENQGEHNRVDYIQFNGGGPLPSIQFNGGGPVPSNPIRIEAESMAVANGTFAIESNSVGQGGLVMAFVLPGTPNETGAITTTFTGASGKYDIELGYFDESDGAGSFTIKINDVVRATVLLNQNTSGTGLADQQAYHQAIVATGIHVNTGDQIRIEGVENQGEHNRVDYIQFNGGGPVPSNPIRIEAESMALSGFGVESNSVASGGQVMAFVNETATESGFATATFTGSSGTYNIRLGYFDESDGAGSFTIKINNVVRATVLLNQNTSGTGLADQQAYRQAIVTTGIQMNSGDQIRIEGVEDQGEHNRVDYIQFEHQ